MESVCPLSRNETGERCRYLGRKLKVHRRSGACLAHNLKIDHFSSLSERERQRKMRNARAGSAELLYLLIKPRGQLFLVIFIELCRRVRVKFPKS